MKNLLIGTSGWSCPEWKNIFYPSNLPQDKMLEYYAQFYFTSEINSTFYQIPTPQVVRAWNKKTPDSFYFSSKIPNIITHKAKLNINLNDSSYYTLENYLNVMTPLISDKKLLTLLLQLPPKFGDDFERDYNRLEKFLSLWTSLSDKIKGKIKSDGFFPDLVIEFRNNKWFDLIEFRKLTLDLLSSRNIACCCVSEPLVPPNLWFTSEQVFYVRFHGFGNKPWFNYNYSEKELDIWAEMLNLIAQSSKKSNWIDTDKIFQLNDGVSRIKTADSNKYPRLPEQKLPNKPPKRVLVYFNNHFSGYAVKNSLYFSKKTAFKTKKNIESIAQPLELLQKGKKQVRLDSFF